MLNYIWVILGDMFRSLNGHLQANLEQCKIFACLGWSGIRVADYFSLQHGYNSKPTTPKLQHASNQEQYDQCGNSTE